MRSRAPAQAARRGPQAEAVGRSTLAALLFLRGRDADARLRAIEAQRARVRPVLGALAVRLRETQGWRRLAFRTLADYAREQLGVGARVVHEWARVWQGLDELPRLREAVLAGEVSWTVARRVVRVATPETDAACVETVRGRTVRAVDALVAQVRKIEREQDATSPAGGGSAVAEADEDEEDEARVAFRMACPRAVGAKWNGAIELARRSKGEQLPVWACAELIAAEVASVLPPEPGLGEGRFGLEAHAASPGAGDTATGDTAGVPSAAPGSDGQAPAEGSLPAQRGPAGPRDPEPGLRASAFPHLPWRPMRPRLSPERELELDRLVEGLEECDAHELDRRLRAAVGFAQSLDAELGRVLRQVVVRELFRELGFRTFKEYVQERLDTAPRTAQRLVRLARAELRAPAVAAAFRQGEVTAFQADVLLGVVERGGPRAPRPAGLQLSQLDGLARLQDLLSPSEEDGVASAQEAARPGEHDGRTRPEESESRGEEHGRTRPQESESGVEEDGVAPAQEAARPGEHDGGNGERWGAGAGDGAGVGSQTADSIGAAARSESPLDLEARWLARARRMTLRRLEVEAHAEPPTAVGFTASPEVVAFFQSVLHRVHRRLVRHERRACGGGGDPASRPPRQQVGRPAEHRVEHPGESRAGHRVERQGAHRDATAAALPPWAALEAMLEHVIVHWMREECAAARAKPRDYLDFNRDGNRCTMPGCTARATLERHHIRYRSDGGPDIPSNRTSLCWFHHHVVVHQQRARIAGQAPDRLLFELGTRPEGPPLARYRSGDVAV